MVLKKLTGLTKGEVKLNREKFGANISKAKIKNKFWEVVKEIVFEPLFIILVFSSFIYTILGERSESVIMLVALIFVSGISIYQENKSRNAVDALKKLANPMAKVIRDGDTIEISSEELVKYDLIVVEDGNAIPADAKILELHDFSVNESILTGESLPIFKELKEPHNTIFKGTMVMTGSCVAQVTEIGSQTTLEKISKSLQEIEIPKTPLQQQIKKFVRSMVVAGAIVFFIVWGINYYLSQSILNALLHALTLAMSILPEEIPVAFSTFMALGAYHMYKQRVIARSPYTVETLGAATVICTDKTGTITENEMRPSGIYDFEKNKIIDYTKEPFIYNSVIEYAMWSSEIEPFDAMEKSIHQVYSSVARIDKRPDYKMIHEYPLSGQPPIMTHVFSNGSEHIIACKGSVEGILKQSKLSREQKTFVQTKAVEFASKGFRVLAVAKSDQDINKLPVSQNELEFDFVGLIAFYDPPKENIKQVFHKFYEAGINVKMITGDYPETAIAIARQIELKNISNVLTGLEVIDMTELQLKEKVESVNIYARMFPEAKLKVIEALKANGEIVAMTGDGVNDGPALKAAHIGIAMGKRGSEIAKKAAALILMDDDLSHMIDAVAMGRRIYENLKKAIQYIISIHIPIILIVTIPLLLFWKFTNLFTPVHVIFLELLMGPTCSIIFEREPIEANSMQKKPRKMGANFFSLPELFLSLIQGLVITSVCLGLGYFFMINNHTESEVRTIIYVTLIFSNLFLTLANRSFYYSVFTTLRYKNNLLSIVLLISIVLLLLSIYFLPVRTIFQFHTLKISDLFLCFASAFAGTMWVEWYKFIKRIN
jgi:Ca2+-transporting ATPase